jgi:ABC-type multidrug transport system ATPase subunit
VSVFREVPGSHKGIRMAILEVRNQVKVFDGFTTVDSISFDLHEGTITGLLGPNGAGKTMTICRIPDLITPTAGTITVFDKALQHHRQEISGRMNCSSAYVSLPSNLKVWENLFFFFRRRQSSIAHTFSSISMGIAFMLNLVYMTTAAFFFNWLWQSVKEKGFLPRLWSE